MYRTDFWTLWEKVRVGCFKRTASKHVYYLGGNRSPARVGCMRQVLGLGALGRPRGIGWRGRWDGGLGWGTHVNPWLIHFNVWQNTLEYCKVISLQLIKKKKRRGRGTRDQIANIRWIINKARDFQKNIYFCFIDYNVLTVWITTNSGKFWKRWEYHTSWSASWETYMQVRKPQLELDMEQQTDSE